MNNNQEMLRRNYNELIELKFVLEKDSSFFAEAGDMQGRHSLLSCSPSFLLSFLLLSLSYMLCITSGGEEDHERLIVPTSASVAADPSARQRSVKLGYSSCSFSI